MTLSRKPTVVGQPPRNVIVDRVEHLLKRAGSDLQSLAFDLHGRAVLIAPDLAEARTRLANARKAFDEAASEIEADDSGLLINEATWSDRNALSDKRNGAAS